MNFGGAVRINRFGLIVLACLILVILLYSYSSSQGGRPIPIIVVVDDDPLLHSAFIRSSKGDPVSTMTSGKVSLRALLAGAIHSAVQGGLEVVAVRKGQSGALDERMKGETKEGVKDSATQGDFRSHKVMYYGLRKAFPEVKVISEEHTETPRDLSGVAPANIVPSAEVIQHMVTDEQVEAEDVSIWIDPLDATKEYTENLVNYVTTMVGVAVRGKPILGVVHRPFSDETYWAVVGHGYSPNLAQDKREEKNNADNKGPLKLIVSRSHAGNVANYTKSILPGEKVEIISAAGAGYKVLEVMLSRADAYVHVTAIKKWDLCAGHALLSALGGSMVTLNGGDQDSGQDELIDFSGHTDPLNTRGILAYMDESSSMEKLKKIHVNQ